MRVTTAFNRLLRLEGARVTDVSFSAEGVAVEVALRRRRAACSSCGQVVSAVHDRSVRRWRHLDLGASRCFIEYRLRQGALSRLRGARRGRALRATRRPPHARL